MDYGTDEVSWPAFCFHWGDDRTDHRSNPFSPHRGHEHGLICWGVYAAGTGINLMEELALSVGGLYRLFGCLPFGPFNKWVAVSATVRPNRLQRFWSF